MSTYYVSSGQTRSGIILYSDDTMYVRGGTADSITMKGASMHVSSGGTANGTTVRGSMIVSSGGTANSATVNFGGTLHVWGGTANSTTVNSSGSSFIFSGGTANRAAINFGGSMYIYDGGTANSATVRNGGVLGINASGTGNSITVNSGGALRVLSGGSATDIDWTPCVGLVYVADGGNAAFVSSYSGVYFGSNDQLLSSALSMNGKTVSGSMYVFSGGRANNTTVNANGSMTVAGGGSANSATVNSGGSMSVSSGGSANSTTVNKSGTLSVSSGGTAGNTIVNGGSMHISRGATANGTTLNANGVLHVSSKGTADNTTINSGGSLRIFDSGAAEDVIVNVGGSMNIEGGTATNIVENGGCVIAGTNITFAPNTFSGLCIPTDRCATVHSGTTAFSTEIDVGASMTVFNGGMADSTVVWGRLWILSGGSANNTMVNASGALDVSSGGTANSTIVNSGALNVSSGGAANNTTVNQNGSLWVSSGGTATEIVENGGYVYVQGGEATFIPNTFSGRILSSDQHATVHSGTTASDTTINSRGILEICSGGRANSATVNSSGYLYVWTGGTANSTTVNSGGWLYVSKGGTAGSVTVNYGGSLTVAGGGSANIVFNPWLGTVNSSAGAMIEYLDRDANVYYGGSHSGLISKWDAISDLTIQSGSSAIVYSGGTADNTTVQSRGCLTVSSGGTANSTTISGYSACMFVAGGGTANSTTVNPNGTLTVSSGGTANGTTLNRFGYLYVSSGGTATNIVENGGYVAVAEGADVTFAPNTITDLVVFSYGFATIHSGTTANSATVNSYGRLTVFSGGTATNIVENGGYVTVAEGANVTFAPNTFSNLLLYTGQSATVHSGTTAVSTTVSASGKMVVSKGGTANNTTVKSSGTLNISSGGTANSTTLVYGGWLHVSSGGTANDTTLQTDGWVVVSSGGKARGTRLDYTGTMRILDSGTAEGTTVKLGGVLNISSGGTADSTTVNSGGSMYVSSGGKVTGTLTLQAGAVVSAYEGSMIDFDISGLNTTAPARVNDLWQIRGTPTYTITISADQAEGTYSLAGGAWGFSGKSISVYCSNVALGSLTVGETMTLAGRDYTLNLSNSQFLSLTVAKAADTIPPEKPVAAADITTPTRSSVTVSAAFSDDSAQKQYSLDGTNWSEYTTGVVMESNGTVYFRGIDAAENISEITSYSVSNIDKVAPNRPAAEADITTPTNKNVTVTAIFSDDSAIKQYSLDGMNWSPYTEGVVFSSNGTAYFRGIDEAGNVSGVAGYNVRNIDKTAPTKPAAEADITTPTNKNVTVTAIFSDDSAIKQYSLDGMDWSAYTADVVFSSNGTVYFRGIDEAGNVSEVTSYEVTNIVPAPVETGVSDDLNGDGRADIVMTIDQSTHPADGSTGAWLIQQDQTAAWGDLSQRNPGWEIFGMGTTLANKTTNDVYVKSEGNIVGAWTTGDAGRVTGWETIGEFSADTQVLGLGDFNGNGQTDLLLRNTNGAVGCFFTGGEKTGWNYFQSLGDEWKLCAVGDLNGDGRDDVVLKHDAGFAGSWLTQADGTMAWADLDTLPDGFAIIGAGDFNGDGTDDVLLKSGNYYGAWLVNNGNAAGWMGLGDLGGVTVEQISDFDGDGKDDLRIRTATGDLGAQLVRGADTLDWKYYGSVGAEWSTSLAAI